eukprot:843212-Pelagomonas_calceolata.AAC.2
MADLQEKGITMIHDKRGHESQRQQKQHACDTCTSVRDEGTLQSRCLKGMSWKLKTAYIHCKAGGGGVTAARLCVACLHSWRAGQTARADECNTTVPCPFTLHTHLSVLKSYASDGEPQGGRQALNCTPAGDDITVLREEEGKRMGRLGWFSWRESCSTHRSTSKHSSTQAQNSHYTHTQTPG